MPTPKKARPIEPLSYDPELGPDYFIQIPQTILKDSGLTDGAFRLYCVLLTYCRQKLTAWPGQETLAEDMGRSVRQIQNLLSQLREVRLVDWQQNGHSSNRYHVYKAPLRSRFTSDRKEPTPLKKPDTQLISPLDTQLISPLDTQLISPESHKLESHELEQQHANFDDVIHKALDQEGFSPKISEKLAKLVTENGRTAEYLNGWINFIHESKEIQRPQGYLRRMLEENNELPKGPPTPAERRAAEDKKRLDSYKKYLGTKPDIDPDVFIEE